MKRLNKYSFRYWCIRIGRHHGSPEYISRGMAVGIFCAFATPILQMLIAIGLAFLFKGAKIPAALGTWISNWLTTPLVLPFQCYLGSLLWGTPLSWTKIDEIINTLSEADSIRDFFSAFMSYGNDIIASFLIGGIMLGIILSIPGYFLTLIVVRNHQANKARKKMETHHRHLSNQAAALRHD